MVIQPTERGSEFLKMGRFGVSKTQKRQINDRNRYFLIKKWNSIKPKLILQTRLKTPKLTKTYLRVFIILDGPYDHLQTQIFRKMGFFTCFDTFVVGIDLLLRFVQNNQSDKNCQNDLLRISQGSSCTPCLFLSKSGVTTSGAPPTRSKGDLTWFLKKSS